MKQNISSVLFSIFEECFPFLNVSEKIFEQKIFLPDNRLFLRYIHNTPAAFSVVHKNTVVLICVHPSHQNKGLGKSLISESEQYIRSAGYDRAVLGRGKNSFFFGAVMDTFSHRFFEKAGYTALNGCLSMFMDISDYCSEDLHNRFRCSDDVSFVFCPEYMKDALLQAVDSVEPKWVSKYSDHSNALIALEGECIAGFMLINDNALTPATSEGFRTGMPEYIGVVSKYRKKHIGTSLLLHGIDIMKMRGCTEIYIEYTSEDTWYSRIGFEDFLWYWMGEKIF